MSEHELLPALTDGGPSTMILLGLPVGVAAPNVRDDRHDLLLGSEQP